MVTYKGVDDEATSSLGGERYEVVNREESLAETEEEAFDSQASNHRSSVYGRIPVFEGHSGQITEHARGKARYRNDIGEEDNEEDEDEDEDERVLERLRSNSPAGGNSIEKPSLIPNESRFNPIEYFIGSLNNALDSLAFDKTLVIQSKMAGELNNSANEVMKIIDEMEFLLKEHIAKYEKLKQEILPEIEGNLRKGTKMANKMTAYVKEVYPVEYSKGRSKILDNLTEDEEGLYS